MGPSTVRAGAFLHHLQLESADPDRLSRFYAHAMNIEDPDGNWIEVSAELEGIHDWPVKHWPHGERTLNYWGRAILRS